MNVNLESLMKANGGDRAKAENDFRKVADLGGFGSVGHGEGQIQPHYSGGLDIAGALAESNTAVSSEAKAEIAKIAGIDAAGRKTADAMVAQSDHGIKAPDGVGASSAPKMKDAVKTEG